MKAVSLEPEIVTRKGNAVSVASLWIYLFILVGCSVLFSGCHQPKDTRTTSLDPGVAVETIQNASLERRLQIARELFAEYGSSGRDVTLFARKLSAEYGPSVRDVTLYLLELCCLGKKPSETLEMFLQFGSTCTNAEIREVSLGNAFAAAVADPGAAAERRVALCAPVMSLLRRALDEHLAIELRMTLRDFATILECEDCMSLLCRDPEGIAELMSADRWNSSSPLEKFEQLSLKYRSGTSASDQTLGHFYSMCAKIRRSGQLVCPGIK